MSERPVFGNGRLVPSDDNPKNNHFFPRLALLQLRNVFPPLRASDGVLSRRRPLHSFREACQSIVGGLGLRALSTNRRGLSDFPPVIDILPESLSLFFLC